MLPIICIAIILRLGHATEGARVLIWTCWGFRQRLVVTWLNFSTALCNVYYATKQCRKRLEACINAEGGHSEHLLWHCLSDIPLATDHNQFFLQSHRRQPITGSFQSLQRLKDRNKPSVRWRSFAVHTLVWWHFQVVWASGLQIVFLWDNVNNQKYAWIILLKMTFFWIFQGTVATSDRWGGQLCKMFMSNFLGI